MNMAYPGIISASVNGSTNFIYVLQSCIEGQPDTFLKGPSTGSINISAYGYAAGTPDKYLGVGCPSRAGVDIPLFTKFDCERNLTRFLPRRGGTAYRAGDPIAGITLVNELCGFPVVDANASSGPFSPYFMNTQFQGTGLIWTGPPISIDTTSTANLAYDITIGPFNIQAFLNSFSIEINPPTGARVNYSFQYSIQGCGDENAEFIPIEELTNFEFLACDTISISYQANGLATLDFTVYSTNNTLVNNYNTMTIGGVDFEGYITSYSLVPIPGTVVYEHKIQVVAIGNPH